MPSFLGSPRRTYDSHHARTHRSPHHRRRAGHRRDQSGTELSCGGARGGGFFALARARHRARHGCRRRRLRRGRIARPARHLQCGTRALRGPQGGGWPVPLLPRLPDLQVGPAADADGVWRSGSGQHSRLVLARLLHADQQPQDRDRLRQRLRGLGAAAVLGRVRRGAAGGGVCRGGRLVCAGGVRAVVVGAAAGLSFVQDLDRPDRRARDVRPGVEAGEQRVQAVDPHGFCRVCRSDRSSFVERIVEREATEIVCGSTRSDQPSTDRRTNVKVIPKNTICLWYDGTALDAARFYAETFPDSKVGAVHRAPGDYPDGKEGAVLTVEFTVCGIPCIGLNGGPMFKHSEAFSFQIATDDQAETDRLWNAIVSNGGQESACGWCKDKWGLSWQITPRVLIDAVNDPDRAAAKRAFDAMMEMRKIDIAAIEAARKG